MICFFLITDSWSVLSVLFWCPVLPFRSRAMSRPRSTVLVSDHQITRDHPIIRSCQPSPYTSISIPKNLRHSIPGMVGRLALLIRIISANQWQGSAFPDHQMSRSPDHPISVPPSPAFFQLLLKTKHFRHSTLGPPLRHAWVALGPRLGHPRATQSQTQSQSAEGREPFLADC